MGGKMRLRTETSKNPSFRVSGSRVTDNPETWINPAKPEDIFGNVLMWGGAVGIGVGMEVDVRTEIGLRLVVVSSFVH